jgi:transposase
MARPRRTDAGLVQKARAALREAQTVEQIRCAQAILLPALSGSTLEQTAALLGVGRSTVPRLQHRFRKNTASGGKPARHWGGRRRALMSMERERSFLAPWVEQAGLGEMLVVSPLRAALAQTLGRPVSASVVYRLLARHGWRKVAPDTRHPKSDPRVQEAWKKNSRKCWQIS